MNSIIEYLKSLVPSSERREMLSVLAGLRDEHNDTLMPVVNEVRELLTDHQFKSMLYKNFEIRLRRHVQFNQPAIGLVIKAIENLQSVFPFLEKEIQSNFGPQIATASLTYDSVNVLRYLDSVAFYIRYARKFLLKVVADEAAALGGTKPDWVRGELEYLDQNLDNFAGLLTAMLKSEGELRQVFRKVSTAMVDEATSDLALKSLGNDKIDPMKLANFSPQKNWLLSLGKALAEWQVNRYRAGKEDLAALQMRLQEMRELQASGKASPAVQKAIGRLEERIGKLDAKLNEIEEEARDERGVMPA
ncbi:hypothetical protein D3C87_1092480 [compost metagenome]